MINSRATASFLGAASAAKLMALQIVGFATYTAPAS